MPYNKTNLLSEGYMYVTKSASKHYNVSNVQEETVGFVSFFESSSTVQSHLTFDVLLSAAWS